MKKIITSAIIALLACGITNAQDFKFGISGYADVYFVNDDNQTAEIIRYMYPQSETRSFALVNSKKNQFDLNIAQISGNFTFKDNVRGKFTLQYGSLPKAAYSADPETVIQEAYAGIKLCDNVWLDAGFYLTHIGGESYLPKDNWLSTHSFVTLLEPIQHAGAKITYSKDKLTAMLGIVNSKGSFTEYNQNKSYTGFVSYNFSSDFSVSYAGIMGNEEIGEFKNYFLSNICANATLTNWLEAKAQFDIAAKEKCNSVNGGYNDGTYTGLSAQLRFALAHNIRATGRFALFNDEDNANGIGIKGNQITLGLEYKPNANTYIRLEGDMMNFDDKYKLLVDTDGKPTNKRSSIALSMGLWID